MFAKYILPVIGMLLLCANVAFSQEDQWSSGRPDGHAPISVMGDHYHKKGDIMLSYRYMPMWMKGNLRGSDDISNENLFENYMIVPLEMQMDMHMAGFMYAPSDRITLMAMGNYVTNTMDLRTRTGVDFTTVAQGLGDLSLTALIKVLNKKGQSIHGNVGISVPTGDIDQRDATPMGEESPLAYPMQLGSGTWDPSLGLTYLGQKENISWGVQSIYKFRLGQNDADYTFGNRFDIVGWGAYKVCDYLSFSGSLSYFNTGMIEGVDADFNSALMPLFDADNSGRRQLDLGIGTNFYIPAGALKNLRIGAEFKIPTYQNVNGIQMKNTLMAIVGIQYSL